MFDNPEAAPAPTRRANRLRNAALASPGDDSFTELVQATDLPPLELDSLHDAIAAVQPASPAERAESDAAPLPGSRRAARLAAQAAAAAPEAPATPVAVEPVFELPATTPLVQGDAEQASDIALHSVFAPHIAHPISEIPVLPAPATSAFGPAADPFTEAVRTFRTAEVPIVGMAPVAQHMVAKRAPRHRLRKVLAAGSSLAAMGVAAAFAVTVTLSPGAVAAAQGNLSVVAASQSLVAGSTPVDSADVQAFSAPEGLESDALERAAEGFTTVTMAEVAAENGINYSDTLFVNDMSAPIQWPFVVGVGMSSAFGQRWGRLHTGVDLVPGAGAPVQAIADGVVRVSSEAGASFGVHVIIDHEIDGMKVSSHYAHMEYGSLEVEVGQHVTVGTILGKTGNTGRSYGAHLHFEIWIDDVPVDPIPFMREYAGG